jgi:hypothetical protein
VSTRDAQATLIANAATKLRRLAQAADRGLWAKAYVATARDTVDADADALFIALMTPDVGIAAAEFLEAVVGWHDEHSTGLTWTHPAPARALAIATALMGGPS